MCDVRDFRRVHRQHGTTLVEVVIFILIVSVAVTAVVNALAVTMRGASDPMIRRQTLAIGESMIQEVDSQPYRQKDPYNPAGPDDAIGPETGEARSGTPLPFDNPNDYSGYTESGIVAPDGTSVSGLGLYAVGIAANQQAMGNVPASDGLLVVVNATGPDGETISLTTFRARYQP